MKQENKYQIRKGLIRQTNMEILFTILTSILRGLIKYEFKRYKLKVNDKKVIAEFEFK